MMGENNTYWECAKRRLSHKKISKKLIVLGSGILIIMGLIINSFEAKAEDDSKLPFSMRAYTELELPDNAAESEITGIAWSPQGQALAAYSQYGQEITLWNVNGTQLENLHRAIFAPYVENSIAFLADNLLLTPPDRSASQSEGSVFGVWDTNHKVLLENVNGTAPNAGWRANWAYFFAVSTDKTTAAMITMAINRQQVAVYKTKTWEELHALALDKISRLSSIALSSDGALVALGTVKGEVAIFSTHTGNLVQLVNAYDKNLSITVKALSFSPDGTEIATGGYAFHKDEDTANLVRVFRVSDGNCIKSLPKMDMQAITSMMWYPRGDDIVFTAEDKLGIWDISSDNVYVEKFSSIVRKAPAPLMCAAFSPDGNYLAVCNGSRVTIYNLVSK